MDEKDSWDKRVEEDRDLAKRWSEYQKIFDEALADFERQFDAQLSRLKVKMDYSDDDIERRILYQVYGLVDTAVIENLDINVTGDFVHMFGWSIEEDDIYCKLYLSVDEIDINYRNRSICKICERYKKTLEEIEENTASPRSEEGGKLLSEISTAFSNYDAQVQVREYVGKYDTAIFSRYDIEKKEWSRLEWRDVQYSWARRRRDEI